MHEYPLLPNVPCARPFGGVWQTRIAPRATVRAPYRTSAPSVLVAAAAHPRARLFGALAVSLVTTGGDGPVRSDRTGSSSVQATVFLAILTLFFCFLSVYGKNIDALRHMGTAAAKQGDDPWCNGIVTQLLPRLRSPRQLDRRVAWRRATPRAHEPRRRKVRRRTVEVLSTRTGASHRILCRCVAEESWRHVVDHTFPPSVSEEDKLNLLQSDATPHMPSWPPGRSGRGGHRRSARRCRKPTAAGGVDQRC